MPHTRTLFLSTHQWILYGCALALSAVGVIFAHANSAFAADLNYSADTPITIGAYNLVIRSGSKATTLVLGATSLTVTVAPADTFTLVSTDRNSFATIPSIEGSCVSTENAITFSGTAIITPQGTVCQKNAGGVAAAPVASSASTPATPTETAKPAVETKQTTETTKQTTETTKQTTETKQGPDTTKSAPASEMTKPAPVPSAAEVAAKAQAEAIAVQITEIKVESVAIAEVPKAAKIGTEEKDVLSEAKDAGLKFTTISKGKAVEIPVAQKLVIVNFLTKDTESTKELDFDQRVDLLKQAAYFNDGKLPKTKDDVTEVLKLANNIPLTDKEIGKNALNAIKKNENTFCPAKTCKGFAQFDAILRGGEAGELTEAAQKKGEKLFKKNVGRKPDLENPLHQNLVEAFALADLSKIKPTPKPKPAPAKPAARSVKKK